MGRLGSVEIKAAKPPRAQLVNMHKDILVCRTRKYGIRREFLKGIAAETHLVDVPLASTGEYRLVSNLALGYNLCSLLSNPYNTVVWDQNLRVTLIFSQNSSSGL